MLSTKRKSRSRLMGGALSVMGVTLGGLVLTASGTQAADRAREKVGSTIGVELATLDPLTTNLAAPHAPIAPLSPVAAQAAPTVPTVSLPPSAAAPADLPSPPVAPEAPPASAAAGATTPAPPAPPRWESTSRIIVLDRSGKAPRVIKQRGGKENREMHFVFRGKDGFKMPFPHGVEGMSAFTVDECQGSDGKGGAKDGKSVTTRIIDGKKLTVVCEVNVKRLAMHAADHAARAERFGRMVGEMAERMAFRTPDIERNAYRRALDGVRNARAGMVANKSLTGEARASALKAMDEAIAELEANLTKVN